MYTNSSIFQSANEIDVMTLLMPSGGPGRAGRAGAGDAGSGGASGSGGGDAGGSGGGGGKSGAGTQKKSKLCRLFGVICVFILIFEAGIIFR